MKSTKDLCQDKMSALRTRSGYCIVDHTVFVVTSLQQNSFIKLLYAYSLPCRYLYSYNSNTQAGLDDLGVLWKSTTSEASKFRGKQSAWRILTLTQLGKIHIEGWNVFDVIVVTVCYLPLGNGMVDVIQIFRLLRVLKIVRAVPELQVG